MSETSGGPRPAGRHPAGLGPAGLPAAGLRPTRIGPRLFAWGERTYLMGIVNVTPDSFSGDGILAPAPARAGGPVEAALAQVAAMLDEGADLVDVGGESTRPGHAPVSAREEMDRVVPIVAAIAAKFPAVPISIDTTKPDVARAALDAGAHLLNDVWGIAAESSLARVAGECGVPIVLMHNRAEARYDPAVGVVGEVVADLRRAVEHALSVGVPGDAILLDPGFGFGKTPDHNLAVLDRLDALRDLGLPVLLGTSRKSTLGKLLDLPPDQRLEATLATTALGIARGADVVRVHDVRPNLRVARIADAVVRGWRPDGWGAGA